MMSTQGTARGATAGGTPLRYPLASLYADYLRAALGLGVTLGPLLLLDVADPVVALLAPLGLLFAWFGLRTVARQLSRVELSGGAIALRPPTPTSRRSGSRRRPAATIRCPSGRRGDQMPMPRRARPR